jgi:phenylacetate-CoA ligase
MKRAFSRKNLWENMPLSIRSGLGFLLRPAPPGLVLGKRFRTCLRFARETEKWSADRARAYQLRELRRVCSLAYEASDYYRRTLGKVGFEPGDLNSTDVLTALPLIDKQTVGEHLREMCVVPPYGQGVDCISTGGSSGRPLKFYIGSERSAVEYAYLVAGWERAGYRTQIPQAVLRGEVVKPDRTGLRHHYDAILRRHYYSNFHMTDENMRRYLEHMAGIGPCYLHVYPSSIYTLACFMKRAGTKMPENIRGLLVGSEIVYPQQREVVSDVFPVPYFSWYGHSEKLVLAAECEHSPHYHVWPTYGYFELLDEEDRPVTTPGQRGEIVGTGFINRVVPFIRYRTGDYATYGGDKCDACGREQTIITDVRGHRTQEHLVAEDGSLIGWTALNMHDDTFDRVRQFQFVQIEPGRATLNVVPAEGFGQRDMEAIRRNLGRKLDERLAFDIELCESIRLTPGGKSIYVDQRIEMLDACRG